MQKYTTLLFDADGTLLDFHRSEREAVIDCFNFFSLPVSEETLNKYSEINDIHWKMLERGEIEKSKLYSARWQAFFDFYGYKVNAEDMSRMYLERLSQKAYVLEDAEAVCQRLSRKCRLYVITNGNKKVQEGRMSKLALSNYFSDKFISEEIGYEKPSIQYFDTVISRIPNFDAIKTLVIGDSLTSDIAGGIGAGLDTCWYNPKGRTAPDGMNITYTIKQLSEIEDIIQ